MKTVHVKDLLRTREIDLYNSRIGQCSDHLWRATKDLAHTVRKYNAENDEKILQQELVELHEVRFHLVQLIERIDKCINPF